MCHQSPQTSKQFTNVYGPLHRRGVRAIGIDTPGFGESDPCPFVPAIEDWAAAVLAVLDHLGIPKAHILGHHTGSLLATEVALRNPGRIQKLVLNGPYPLRDEERPAALAKCKEQQIDFVHSSDGAHLTRSFAVRTRFYGPGADPATITRYVVEKFQGYAPFWVGHHAASIYDQFGALKQVTQPTLILTNTGDMIHDKAKAAHAARPDFSFKVLEGGGIDIVDQQPEEWADTVVEFLMS
jgi:pimeloyl-ACP methyl ester carboxylesterase